MRIQHKRKSIVTGPTAFLIIQIKNIGRDDLTDVRAETNHRSQTFIANACALVLIMELDALVRIGADDFVRALLDGRHTILQTPHRTTTFSHSSATCA